MKIQKVRADLSTVYDNRTTNLTGLSVGERGCFSDDKDFKKYDICVLHGVLTTSNYPYLANTGCSYMYYIPLGKARFEEVDVKSSYRKFKSIDEFEYVTKYHFSMGESVIIRNKKTLNESELVYGGYFVNDQSETLICLGSFVFTLDELFKGYEFHINSCFIEWHPFGVKE